MKTLFSLGIGRQLALAFAVVVGLFLVVAAWTAASLGRVTEAAERIAGVSLAKEERIAALTDAYARMRESVRNNIIFTDGDVMKAEAARYAAEKQRYAEALAALEQIAGEHAAPGELEILQRIRRQSADAFLYQDRALAEAMQFLSAVAMGILQQEAMPRMQALDLSLADARASVQAQSRERAGGIVAIAERTAMLALALAIASGLVASLLGFVLTRAVSQPLEATAGLMEQVAGGDLSGGIAAAGCAEVRRVQDAAVRTTTALARMFGAIRNEAASLKAAVVTLSGAAEDMRGASGGQAQAAADMAATLREMAGRIAHLAALGGEAQALSAQAGQLAGCGRLTIAGMVEEMERIAAAVSDSASTAQALGGESERITAITAVIHDLADQTNLLALNAAIEAARAGDSGRGFAVVADEVRKLAEKTTTSASQIAVMVNAIQGGSRAMAEQMRRSVGRVDEGLRLARAAGESMQAIDDSNRRVAEVIAEVSDSLHRQRAAGDEIGQRVGRIVNMVENNQQATDSMAYTARQLDLLAGTLESSIGRFRTA